MSSDNWPVMLCSADYPHLPHKGHIDRRWSQCPGIKIPAASRAVQPRARIAVVTDLRYVASHLRELTRAWVQLGPLANGRPRKVVEYPENDARKWERLATVCRLLAERLQLLATAADRYAAGVDKFDQNRRVAAAKEQAQRIADDA